MALPAPRRAHVLDLPSTPALSEASLPLVSEGPGEGGACEDMSPHAWEPSGVRAAGGGLRGGEVGGRLGASPREPAALSSRRGQPPPERFCDFLSAGMSELSHFLLCFE